MAFMEYWWNNINFICYMVSSTTDVRINEWFGEFYDTLQKALTEPNSVTEKEFIAYLFTFAK